MQMENTHSFDEMGTSVLGKKLLDISDEIVYLNYIMDELADYSIFRPRTITFRKVPED